MNLKTRFLFFVAGALLLNIQFINICFAAAEPASFLLIGAGARPAGMGGAFTALADESSAVYWNPAGLSLLKKKEFSGMYGSLFTDTTYSFISYAHPIFTGDNNSTKKGEKKEKRRIAVGAGWLQLRSVNIEKTNQVESLGHTQMVNDAFFLSGSMRPLESFPLYLGISGKRISQNIDAFSSEGWGMDLGILIDGKFLNFGVNVQNIGKTEIKGTSYWNGEQVKELIPCHVRSGVVLKAKKVYSSLVDLLQKDVSGSEYSIYEPRISQDPQALKQKEISHSKKENEQIDIKVNLALDFDYVLGETDYLEFYHGVECWVNEIYGLRLSFMDDFSAGASLKYEYFSIDYAFILKPKLKDTHRFSLTMMF